MIKTRWPISGPAKFARPLRGHVKISRCVAARRRRAGHGSCTGIGVLTMFRIRLHGRGGQGIKTASRVLGTAFFLEGFEVQDAPRYGAERRAYWKEVE